MILLKIKHCVIFEDGLKNIKRWISGGARAYIGARPSRDPPFVEKIEIPGGKLDLDDQTKISQKSDEVPMNLPQVDALFFSVSLSILHTREENPQNRFFADFCFPVFFRVFLFLVSFFLIYFNIFPTFLKKY